MKNKEIKNIIDNIQEWYELSYKWGDYILTDFDEAPDVYEFANTNKKENYIYLDYDELFDILFEEHVIDSETNRGVDNLKDNL